DFGVDQMRGRGNLGPRIQMRKIAARVGGRGVELQGLEFRCGRVAHAAFLITLTDPDPGAAAPGIIALFIPGEQVGRNSIFVRHPTRACHAGVLRPKDPGSADEGWLLRPGWINGWFAVDSLYV